jgi:hypothetical protein
MMMKLLQQIADRKTTLGRIPAEVYGLLWSASWLSIVALLCIFIPRPWGALSGLAIEAVAFFVTLRVTRA